MMRRIHIEKLAAPVAAVAGSAPMLQWVDIDKLRIDDDYQRSLKKENWTAIRRIASAFTWSRFSPVFLAPIEGGLYAVIDGQHRTHAAALCGFTSVPAQIVQMSREEQAQAFAAVNGNVTKVTVWNLYRASLAGGVAWAIDVRDCALAAGCKVAESNSSTSAKEAGEIYAVDGFRKVVEKHSAPIATLALRLLMRCDGWKSEAVYWEGGLLLPILDVLCAHPKLLDQPAFAEAFAKWPVFDVVDEISKAVKAAARSGMPYRPKREQLQETLTLWIAERTGDERPAPAETAPRASVVVPATVQAPATGLHTNMITAEQRKQLDEARQRRARLGMR